MSSSLKILRFFNTASTNLIYRALSSYNIFSYPESITQADNPLIKSPQKSFSRLLSTTFSLNMPLFGHAQSSLLDTLSRGKLYEMKIIITKPSTAGEFLKLTEECIPLKRQTSKLIGSWKTEFGEINTMIMLWEYESYHECMESRKHMAQDPNWKKNYSDKIFPMLSEEESTTLRKITDQPLTVTGAHPPKGEVYYRWNTYIIKHPIDANVVKFKELSDKYYKSFTDAHITSVCHLGTFLPDSDKMSKVYEFVRYGDLDDNEMYKKRDTKEMQSLKSDIGAVSSLVLSEILIPNKFSPLQ